MYGLTDINVIDIKEIYNNTCVKCGESHRSMTRIGAFVMCHGCKSEEFGTMESIHTENDKLVYDGVYLKWLQEYQKG